MQTSTRREAFHTPLNFDCGWLAWPFISIEGLLPAPASVLSPLSDGESLSLSLALIYTHIHTRSFLLPAVLFSYSFKNVLIRVNTLTSLQPGSTACAAWVLA